MRWDFVVVGDNSEHVVFESDSTSCVDAISNSQDLEGFLNSVDRVRVDLEELTTIAKKCSFNYVV